MCCLIRYTIYKCLKTIDLFPVTGSGLTKAEGYKEYTNEWICLEHSTANCSIY